jgi:hypothetical protein
MKTGKPSLLIYMARGVRGDFESKLIKCPACSHEVSSVAANCPSCGQPIKPQQSFGYVAGAFIIAVILIFIAFSLWF